MSQQSSWKEKGQSEEARYIRKKLQEETQLDAIRNEQKSKDQEQKTSSSEKTDPLDRDFEGGFGGQEDLEDRYATTSGEH
ncbi:hypothetical protein BYT27DRAFT_7203586 [Phlegmacium glaucopus]|nr:hypothetical protein BYT27DRAFT_7203586 [Phlegmacium glaucopus]